MTAPLSIGQALQLARSQIDLLDARVLLREAAQVATSTLIAFPERMLTAEQTKLFLNWLERRVRGEPVAYILGWREFYGRRFSVTPDTLIPRPDTELLVERALVYARECGVSNPRVLDLGTGSGAIAITLALENGALRITAVDRSATALAVAQRNAQALAAQIEFLRSDWFSALAGQRYDIVVSNPPYIRDADEHLGQGDVRFEPASALSSGSDGLDDIRHIIKQSAQHMEGDACLLLEHGYDQAQAVQVLLAAAGFVSIESWRDLAGIERATSAIVKNR